MLSFCHFFFSCELLMNPIHWLDKFDLPKSQLNKSSSSSKDKIIESHTRLQIYLVIRLITRHRTISFLVRIMIIIIIRIIIIIIIIIIIMIITNTEGKNNSNTLTCKENCTTKSYQLPNQP